MMPVHNLKFYPSATKYSLLNSTRGISLLKNAYADYCDLLAQSNNQSQKPIKLYLSLKRYF